MYIYFYIYIWFKSGFCVQKMQDVESLWLRLALAIWISTAALQPYAQEIYIDYIVNFCI